jgi:uncharacterized protein YjlB
MSTTKKRTAPPIARTFADDGRIPNNPLPLLLYRGAVDLAGSPDPERVIEKTFKANGWGDIWRNGIFPYVHYHSMIHEVMGVARGHATVRFGGDNGQAIDLVAGDVVILPAGTGRRRLMQSADLMVVGAYPPSGKYNLCRGSKHEHAKALVSIPKVPPPTTDPAFGVKGPLIALWRI